MSSNKYYKVYSRNGQLATNEPHVARVIVKMRLIYKNQSLYKIIKCVYRKIWLFLSYSTYPCGSRTLLSWSPQVYQLLVLQNRPVCTIFYNVTLFAYRFITCIVFILKTGFSGLLALNRFASFVTSTSTACGVPRSNANRRLFGDDFSFSEYIFPR